MNLGELKTELNLIVQDASLFPYFNKWINEAIQSLAMQYDFLSLRRLDPFNFPIINTAWYREAPEVFQKNVFRCYNGAGNKVAIRDRIENLEALDWDHDQTASNISRLCAFEQGDRKYFAYYPKATESIQVWFYEKPAILVNETDSPTFIPREFHTALIIPELIIKNFQLLQDMVVDAPHNSLSYWLQRKQAGLFGSKATGEVGFFNWLVKSRGGRRRLGGPDPLP